MNNKFLYEFMVFTTKIRDLFGAPGAVLLNFAIKHGDTVVDYGCGPGRYIKKASELVGETGKVIAADISAVGIAYVQEKIVKHGLKNVHPVLIGEGKIPAHSADVVYALDMFHQVKDPQPFLAAIRMIIKENGFLYLEDGHQSRRTTLNKVKQSELWKIEAEHPGYLCLKPL